MIVRVVLDVSKHLSMELVFINLFGHSFLINLSEGVILLEVVVLQVSVPRLLLHEVLSLKVRSDMELISFFHPCQPVLSLSICLQFSKILMPLVLRVGVLQKAPCRCYIVIPDTCSMNIHL